MTKDEYTKLLLREVRKGTSMPDAMLSILPKVEKEKDPDMQAFMLVSIANHQAENGKSEIALGLYKEARRVIEKISDPLKAGVRLDHLIQCADQRDVFDLDLALMCGAHINSINIRIEDQAKNN